MSKRSFTTKLALTMLLGLALMWHAAEAMALSVEWKNLSGRERVIIRLDAADGRIGAVARNSSTSIGLVCSSGTKNFAMAAPGTAKLFGGIEAAPGGLSVKVKTVEFGFIVTRPASGVLHVDIYKDPLGKRWKSASAKTKPAPAPPDPKIEPAAPEAPAPAPVLAPGASPKAVSTGQPAALPVGQSADPQDPSSVFSSKIKPPSGEAASPAPATSAPAPAPTPALVPAPVPEPAPLPQPPARLSAPLEEGDDYKLPEWPPLEMPSSLPAPPPPPPSSSPSASPGAELGPVLAPQSVAFNGLGGALSVFESAEKKRATRRFAWRELLPFATTAHAASTTGEEQNYQTVQAPFAYRALLNVDNAPDWVEQPIPVLIRVPSETVFDVHETVPREGAAQPPEDAPLPVDEAPVGLPPAAFNVPSTAPIDRPSEETITAPPVAPQPVPSPPQSEAVPTGPVIYVDEMGNPVDPPLEPGPTLRDVDKQINDGNYAEAVQKLDKLLLQHNLSRDQREVALHRKADATFSLYENDLAANYQAVIDSSTAAINFNTRSQRNAASYLRLGYTNIVAGNAYEAAGYFNVLRREFPRYENIPLTYYYWGDYQYTQGHLNEAVEQFNYIVNNYPEHPISRDAALGLARSYYRMGYFEDALKIMLFVEQRWPSFYLDYPPVLSMLGDVAYRVGNLDKARSSYWLYYNLAPYAEDADMVLTRLGDIYSAGKYHSAAVQVYTEALTRFPTKDGGVISRMRLAEDGVYDDPSVSDMFKVFDRPYDQRPAEAYRTIIREFPGSPLVTLAKLKLAMWMLWQKDYVTVLDLCSEIIAEAPNSTLAPRASEVAMSAFTLLAAEDTNDKRYSRAREVWDRYPILQTQVEFLDPESRLALAVSQWNTGSNAEALATLEPFFYGAKAGEISEMALFLTLNIMTEHYQWEQIEELSRRVELWELTPQASNQMNYALALAYENMDKPEAAAPLWSGIYGDKLLPPTQMANAAFYLARSAERSRDLESAYYVGQDALQRLTGVTQTDPENADVEKIKTQLVSLLDIAESSGVLAQALEYAQQYLQYVNEGSLDQQSVSYRMARIHKKRGDTAEWLRILEDISGKYPDSVFGKTAKSELASYRLGSEAARFSNMQF